MKLSKFTEEELITFSLKGEDKEDIIEELVDIASKSKLVRDRDELLKDIIERENLVTTGVGYGVAFPHAKTKAVKGIVIAFGRSDKGIDFDAMDKKPVNLFFLIAAPEDAIGAHLNVMARLSFLMKSEENREKLLKVNNKGELLAILDSVE
ncbi:MAG: PTS sugar transporter subunit IIA [candidate division Zixibacteria bacterium]|jgi:fructose-specific phosphotransferase system IIA component|nr:PTS sugar transporter subunit IIA [candidate division Zixibacteria bacterium]NIR68314.1 PTS sugar transporter subunit IIA [candidate division Zixibacteria bacterium]NIS18295.1 PTS sugar transporter subunit IIA [candidate division Zixibacteria bacterium]NIS49481.1 PTS sugar transporter subunit IIA [candidate division Zixibacteria bacterium]NIT54618.1 PTS sugar transporter subunit IIA [candidate division Zixibacteria bacterium]